MVKLCQGISINDFQSLPQDRFSYFDRELLVTDNARSISKHMLMVSGEVTIRIGHREVFLKQELT